MEAVVKDQGVGVGNNLVTETDVMSHASDLFSPSSQEISMLDGRYINFRRLNENNEGPFVFNLNPQGMQYLQLSSARLFIEGKIVDDKGKDLLAADNGKMGLTNLPGSAMFSSIDIAIDGVPFPELSNKYSNYKGYLETVLTYSPENARGHLAAAHFFMDTATKFDTFDTTVNEGHVARAKLVNESAKLQISTPLASDFFQLDRLFPPGVKITVTLTKSDDKFFICSGVAKSYKFQIEDMYLSIRHINLTPETIAKHQHEIISKSIVLPYNKTTITTQSFGAGASAMRIVNLVDSTLPKSIIIGFVKATNFHGSFATNPFYFTNCNISSLHLNVNGESVPSLPYRPDFAKALFTREVSKYDFLFPNLT